MKLYKALGLAFLVAGLLYFSALMVSGHVYRRTFHYVCNLVEKRYYQSSQDLKRWARRCRHKAGQVSWHDSRQEFLGVLRRHLHQLPASHLDIFTPQEDERLWKGRAPHTGIRARRIDGHLIVYDVISKSSASAAGLQPGDEILAINKRPVHAPKVLAWREGRYKIRRHDKLFYKSITTKPLSLDGRPEVKKLTPQIAWLKISSFRREYFVKNNWKRLIKRLEDYNHVIVDLRGNTGGDFVALLRALSSFLCQPQFIGHLEQPRQEGPVLPRLQDKMSFEYQMDQLESYSRLRLKTFPNYGCAPQSAVVLVNQETASVAEIFAHVLSQEPNMYVWGAPTAGEVILAVWHELPPLGQGYSLSIPEAIYRGPEGGQLENRGVRLDKRLRYRLKEAQNGKDSWIQRALEKWQKSASTD